MKFAVVKYAPDRESLPGGLFRKWAPQRLYNFYLCHSNPYKYREIQILGAEGYEVTLPLLLPQAEENRTLAERLIQKTAEDFEDKQVGIYVIAEGGVYPGERERADGRTVMAFFAMEAAAKALKALGKDRKDSRFLLIDGGNLLTQLTLDCIYPYVNALSIYTDRVENFEQETEDIYEDTGLNVQVFSNSRNVAVKEADVILNVGADIENYDYYFKKCAVYLDIAGNRRKLRRLLLKRQDMLFIDGMSLRQGTEVFDAALAEAAFYAGMGEFRSFMGRSYDRERAQELCAALKREEFHIDTFYCDRKKISPQKYEFIERILAKKQ